MMHGARRWYFPDGYLPKGRKNDLSSHESICILNANEEDAEIKITLFFEDEDPISFEVTVPSRRDIHIRLDKKEIVGFKLPREKPYGVMLESNIPIIAQLSRMDVSEDHYTLMTTIGYWED